METTKTLFKVSFSNHKAYQIDTKYVPACSFKEAYTYAELLLHTHSEFASITQVVELHPITIITQSTYGGDNTNKQQINSL